MTGMHGDKAKLQHTMTDTEPAVSIKGQGNVASEHCMSGQQRHPTHKAKIHIPLNMLKMTAAVLGTDCKTHGMHFTLDTCTAGVTARAEVSVPGTHTFITERSTSQF